MQQIVLLFSIFSLLLLMGASSCSRHATYRSSFSAGVDEVVFLSDGHMHKGIGASKWVRELKIKVPNEKNTWLSIRTGAWIEQVDITYPYTTIFLPDNGEKIVSIGLASDTLKLTGTFYRENKDYQLKFKANCGEILEVDGVGACQIPVNSSLELKVTVEGMGRIVVLSSMCDFKNVREGVSGSQTYKIKGTLCPITIKVDDALGIRYGGFLARTATDSYIPIKSPKIKKNKVYAPSDVNYMEREFNGEYVRIKRNKSEKRLPNAIYWLWDIKNSRMRLWKD